MKRKTFLLSTVFAPALVPAQEGPPRAERVEQLTAGAAPRLAINHLGFLPKARKRVILRATGEAAPSEFLVRDVGSDRFGWYGQPPEPRRLTRLLAKADCDFGPCLTGEFTELERPGMYQITIPGERSVPIFIRPDVWRRTLPKAVGYIHAQRCGTEVPNVHEVCHLNDARRRDTGEHRNVVGGWHDAGDLRKWMSATMLNGFALLELAETWPRHPDAPAWRDAVRLYLDEFVLPMSARNAYRIIPYGLFFGAPTRSATGRLRASSPTGTSCRCASNSGGSA